MALIPMTLDEYRQALTAAVEAAKAGFTDYTIVMEYDNRVLVKPGEQANPVMSVSIIFSDGSQGDLSANPFHRMTGMLTLSARSKEGDGTAKAYKLVEHFYPKLHRRTISQVNLEIAKPIPPKKLNGEWVVSVVIPFWLSKVY